MEVKGTQKIKATRNRVFSALLNPDILKNSIPGCTSAECENLPTGQQIRLKLTPNVPGFKGPYTIYLNPIEVSGPSHIVYVTEPSNAHGRVKATCTVKLAEDTDGTLLAYNGNAELSGKIAATPEVILSGILKTALTQFFKSFEKQVALHSA